MSHSSFPTLRNIPTVIVGMSCLFVCIPKKLDVAACVGIHYVPEYHVKLRCIGVVVLGCS